MEVAHGLFVAEGEKVIRRAIAAGYPMRSLLVTQDKLAGQADLIASCPGPVYVIAPATAEALTGYRVHRGTLASMQRLPLPAVAGLVDGARRVVVLEDIVDHANVGAIFRCAAALGFDAVILAPRCADPLYRRAVKVSMGAVFAVPYARLDDWRGGLAGLSQAGFQVLALTPAADAVPIEQAPACREDRPAARHRGRRAVVSLARCRRCAGPDPDERGSGLAQRGIRRRDRLLPARPPLFMITGILPSP